MTYRVNIWYDRSHLIIRTSNARLDAQSPCRVRLPRRTAPNKCIADTDYIHNDAIRHAITYTCGDYILLRRYNVSPTDLIKFSPSVSFAATSLLRGRQETRCACGGFDRAGGHRDPPLQIVCNRTAVGAGFHACPDYLMRRRHINVP